MTARRSSSRPPPTADVRAASAQVVADLLRHNHRLEVPSAYLLIVEGTTDCHYLRRAAELACLEFGQDLLRLDPPMSDGLASITVCTPINPEDPAGLRGGVPQIERLAGDLRPSVLNYEIPSPLCIVLDHDAAALEAAQRLRKLGYNIDRARIETLEPKHHPHACRTGRGEACVVIEDLLSLRLQQEFLQSTRASCDVTLVDGQIVRCAWHTESKPTLCEFACRDGDVRDMIELVRVLVRVRQLWRLDVAPKVLEFLNEAPPPAVSPWGPKQA